MRTAYGAAIVGALLLACGACAPAGDAVRITCAVLPAGSGAEATADGPVRLDIRLGDGALRDRGRLIVRVDPLDQPGAVHFDPAVPRTAGAASLGVDPGGRFHGCIGGDPAGFRLHASDAPRGRLWARVSSDRPVEVSLTVPAGMATAEGSAARVEPGASVAIGWRPARDGRP